MVTASKIITKNLWIKPTLGVDLKIFFSRQSCHSFSLVPYVNYYDYNCCDYDLFGGKFSYLLRIYVLPYLKEMHYRCLLESIGSATPFKSDVSLFVFFFFFGRVSWRDWTTAVTDTIQLGLICFFVSGGVCFMKLSSPGFFCCS